MGELMGISKLFAEMFVREHAYQPLVGETTLVSRQTVDFLPHEIRPFMTGLGVTPVAAYELELDLHTRASVKQSISDRAFFGLLGVRDLRSMDVSRYEASDIICDLNEPLPKHLLGTADVVVDGATLDNVFNPAQALLNLAGMLRPGGRLLMFNMGSNHSCPYVILTPLWFYDYFVGNGFPRVLVYVSVRSQHGRNVFVVRPQNEGILSPNLTSGYEMTIFVLAQRGGASTHSLVPIQHQYRDRAADCRHKENIALTLGMAGCIDHLKSDCPQFLATPGGYRFIPA